MVDGFNYIWSSEYFPIIIQEDIISKFKWLSKSGTVMLTPKKLAIGAAVEGR